MRIHTGEVSTEVERKFMVEHLPAEDALGVGVALRQGYLASEGDVEVRLRIAAGGAVLTVKAGRGLSRTEVESRITTAEADSLWASTAGRRIEKVRHRVGVSGHVAEVDVYAGDLDGLLTVEVEFASEAAASAFRPPDWFGRELTGDPNWSNAALARHGRPDR